MDGHNAHVTPPTTRARTNTRTTRRRVTMVPTPASLLPYRLHTPSPTSVLGRLSFAHVGVAKDALRFAEAPSRAVVGLRIARLARDHRGDTTLPLRKARGGQRKTPPYLNRTGRIEQVTGNTWRGCGFISESRRQQFPSGAFGIGSRVAVTNAEPNWRPTDSFLIFLSNNARYRFATSWIIVFRYRAMCSATRAALRKA